MEYNKKNKYHYKNKGNYKKQYNPNYSKNYWKIDNDNNNDKDQEIERLRNIIETLKSKNSMLIEENKYLKL